MALNSESLRLFLTVVDTGSMSAAAEALKQTASGVSRGIARLEQDLGLSLLTRTTRRMELTEEGQHFLLKARQIIEHLDELEDGVRRRHQQPAGKLRIDASVPVMLHCVVPHVAEFRRCYPDICLELTSNDRIVDLLEYRSDIALRTGPLTDSTLHARLLCSVPRFLVASPDYLARCGTPRSMAELASHELLGFTQPETLNRWPLQHDGGSSLQVIPTLATSSGETQRQLAINGVGILCASLFAVKKDLQQGRLVRVLEHLHSDYVQPLHAVYYRNSELAQRIRCFLDFYLTRIQANCTFG